MGLWPAPFVERMDPSVKQFLSTYQERWVAGPKSLAEEFDNRLLGAAPPPAAAVVPAAAALDPVTGQKLHQALLQPMLGPSPGAVARPPAGGLPGRGVR